MTAEKIIIRSFSGEDLSFGDILGASKSIFHNELTEIIRPWEDIGRIDKHPIATRALFASQECADNVAYAAKQLTEDGLAFAIASNSAIISHGNDVFTIEIINSALRYHADRLMEIYATIKQGKPGSEYKMLAAQQKYASKKKNQMDAQGVPFNTKGMGLFIVNAVCPNFTLAVTPHPDAPDKVALVTTYLKFAGKYKAG